MTTHAPQIADIRRGGIGAGNSSVIGVGKQDRRNEIYRYRFLLVKNQGNNHTISGQLAEQTDN